MSTYYIFDPHVSTIANARLVDAVQLDADGDSFRVDGMLPIRIPDGVKVVNPTSLTDVLTQKYAGLLALYPGYTNIIYDDFLDSTGTSPLASRGQRLGSLLNCAGEFDTVAVDVSPTVISQCIVVFEYAAWEYVDVKTSLLERHYYQVPSTTNSRRVDLSVNNGSDYLLGAESGAVTLIPLGDEGSLVTIDFQSLSPNTFNGLDIYVTSWAVIY